MKLQDRPAWVSDELFPFESRFVEIGGARVHHIDEGRGPTLLFLHGNPTWSFLYRDVIAGLRGEFRCIALDYPGFGLSTAPPSYGFSPREHASVVREFIRALDLRDLTVMVHDWGGPIGLWAAAQERDRIGGLVIGNTWGWPVNGQWHFEWFSKLMGGPLGRTLIRRANVFVDGLIPFATRLRKPTEEVMAAYRGPFPTPESRRPIAVFPKAITGSGDFLREVERGLDSLAELPALILWGDRDIAARAKERARFERTFSRSRTVVLEGAGHYIQEDAPERIADEIRTWYAEAVGRPL